MLTYGAVARRYRPRWLVWENVPGVLSSHKGRDFSTFLGMLAELGYGFATAFLTLSTSEHTASGRAVPQLGAVVCSLSDILETGDRPLEPL